MKKILLIIIAVVALCACGDNRKVQSSNQSREPSEQQDSDTLSNKDLAALQKDFVELNKSKRDNKSRIDSMKLSLQNVNEKLDSKVEFQVIYVLLSICVLLLILVVVALIGIYKLQKSKDKIKKSLESHKVSIDKLTNDVLAIGNKSGRSSYDCREDIVYLGRQLEELKAKLDRNSNINKGTKTSVSVGGKKDETLPANDVKGGYFGVNDDRGIIGKIYASATEEAVFQYYVKSDNLVDFEPLSLKRIRSISTIRTAVNVVGGSLQDATEMIITKRGRAIQREQSGQKYWEILYPAEVNLK